MQATHDVVRNRSHLRYLRMASGLALVSRISAKAHESGTAASIAQFDNLATHGQYEVPYATTARHVSAGDDVLDWGCGNGHFSLLLRHLGAQVTGFSFEPPPAAMAGDPGFSFVAGSEADPRTLPFPDERFSTVCSVGVLEHVWETGGSEDSSLAEIARVLRPGGTFLTFHLPSRHGWVEPVFGALGLLEYRHGRRYDAESIAQLYRNAGLDILEMGRYNFLPRNQVRRLPAALRRAPAFARAYALADRLCSAVLGALDQNYFVVARKRD
jgi:SAM-dependent methyltransferase